MRYCVCVFMYICYVCECTSVGKYLVCACVCLQVYVPVVYIFTRRMYNIVEASGSIYACRDMLVTK